VLLRSSSAAPVPRSHRGPEPGQRAYRIGTSARGRRPPQTLLRAAPRASRGVAVARWWAYSVVAPAPCGPSRGCGPRDGPGV